MTAPVDLTAEARRSLLARAEGARVALDEVAGFLVNAHGAYAHQLQQHVQRYERDLMELRDQYLELVPPMLVARCPFTDTEVRHSVDTAGLDGLWWRWEQPVRPAAEPVPPTWLAMTGAMELSESVEDTPFLVRPGPAAPGVLPRMLEHESVRAVVCEVPVGRHRGFAVSYFADGDAAVVPVNTWGASEHRFLTRGSGMLSADLPATDDEFDFELGPWIERGKLSWIAPGDETAELRTDLAGCPYLDLDGTREMQHIEGGAVWTASTIEPRSDR